MLESIHIQNFGLVEDSFVDFHKNVTMFSGETGAGKSMLLSAILLLLGERTSADAIRDISGQAVIAAVWDISKNLALKNWLEEKGIEINDDSLLTKRIIKPNGRNICLIHGNTVTVKELSECVNFLCEVHAQHEHQSLFNTTTQLFIIDRYAGISTRVEQFSQDLIQYIKKARLYEKNQLDEAQRLKEIDYLEFAIKEIEGAKIKLHEEEDIINELAQVSNIEKITELWQEISLCFDNDAEVLHTLRSAKDALSKLQEFQSSVAPYAERFTSVLAEFDDLSDELEKEKEVLESLDPERVIKLETRLTLLESLKRKYAHKAKTLESVQKFKDESIEKLESLQNFSENSEHIKEELKITYTKIVKESKEISSTRKQSAQTFAEEVSKVLHNLAMPNANFLVDFSETKISAQNAANGIDKIEFLISSNKGEKHYPLAKIASGGELSRIMLAIKVISSKNESLQTLVLDEVDAGIGGNTAKVLAEYLYQLGNATQIICVSHLPVVVACAQLHYLVQKQEKAQRTCVGIHVLQNEERVRELARMIIGEEDDVLAQSQAAQLLAQYVK